MKSNNKFGMFIHWGLYSVPAVHEQILARYELDPCEYEGLMDVFNPTEYDPEEWVLLAKRAGMEYICITAKHHDGFCMWDTKQTDYNIMNTPYKKDVIGMLADAAHKHGMLLSFYYSNPDWHHPKGYNPASTHQWRSKNIGSEADTEGYREYVKAQIRELLTNYGPVYSFFWDIPPKLYDPSMNELIRELQPNIIINDRGWSEGDFATPERELCKIEGARFSGLTEACNSLGEQSWGYRKDEDFYSVKYLISAIDRIMAMGGSYLLNVGPDSKGRITKEYSDRLMKIGDWYNRMGGALVGHDREDIDIRVLHGECIKTRKGGKTYLHFYSGTISSAVIIEGAPSLPRCVTLLNTSERLGFAIEKTPDEFDFETGVAKTLLHIRGIPIDDLASEAVVIEIEW